MEIVWFHTSYDDKEKRTDILVEIKEYYTLDMDQKYFQNLYDRGYRVYHIASIQHDDKILDECIYWMIDTDDAMYEYDIEFIMRMLYPILSDEVKVYIKLKFGDLC